MNLKSLLIMPFIAGTLLFSSNNVAKADWKHHLSVSGYITNSDYSVSGVSKELQTTKIHPKDMHPGDDGTEGTTTEIGGGGETSVEFDAYYSFGNEFLNINLGIKLLDQGPDPICYERQFCDKKHQQVTHHNANVYSKITFSKSLIAPFIGLEALIGNFRIGFNFGKPQAEFKFSSGHDRWGRFDEQQKADWKGSGELTEWKLDYFYSEECNSYFRRKSCEKNGPGWRFGVRFGSEKYEPIFNGEKAIIERNFVGGGMGYTF